MTTYRSFIDGEWTNSASGRTAPNINPADIEDTIGTIELASRDEAKSAVDAAYNAFRGWKATPAPARGRIVARAARVMEERKEELAAAITREEGKTISEARGEVQRAGTQVAAHGVRAGGQRHAPHPPPSPASGRRDRQA